MNLTCESSVATVSILTLGVAIGKVRYITPSMVSELPALGVMFSSEMTGGLSSIVYPVVKYQKKSSPIILPIVSSISPESVTSIV